MRLDMAAALAAWLLACLAFEKAAGTNYAVVDTEAEKVCGLSRALKGTARGVAERSLAAAEEAASVSQSVAALAARLQQLETRIATQGMGRKVAGTEGEEERPEAGVHALVREMQHQVRLAQQKIKEALNESSQGQRKARGLTIKAGRLAGHMDGMIAMLHTWYSGKATATQNTMCIAKSPTSARKWGDARLVRGSDAPDSEKLAGCYETEDGKGDIDSLEQAAKRVGTTLVKNVAESKSIARISEEDVICPLLSSHTGANAALWNGAADRPFLKLGGLWALVGEDNKVQIRLNEREPQNNTSLGTDEKPPPNAAKHADIREIVQLAKEAEAQTNKAGVATRDAKEALAKELAIEHNRDGYHQRLEQWIAELERGSASTTRQSATTQTAGTAREKETHSPSAQKKEDNHAHPHQKGGDKTDNAIQQNTLLAMATALWEVAGHRQRK
ncbi:hypothetical protein, conserved in T.vivax [Trypanosoma vivax Y486]|uniref:Uncharacterized protein n=1 Tax=Trypanosoma vivax (strain Y486) TaxID=1055687 RepID=F9WQZ3_TRYVY|nr:hypothetical protein, conserved in T.vivax [Trypanosoma vivax Y486]|eukprot:CCD19975.1 hypothetical protein, conserved in T.vivax [Trypanosoma vivax Y486]